MRMGKMAKPKKIIMKMDDDQIDHSELRKQEEAETKQKEEEKRDAEEKKRIKEQEDAVMEAERIRL